MNECHNIRTTSWWIFHGCVVCCVNDDDDADENDEDDDDDVAVDAEAEHGWGKTRKVATALAASMMVAVAVVVKDNIHNNIIDGLTSANLRSSICTYNGFRSNVKTSFAPINYSCNKDKWIQAKNVINRRKLNFILSTLSVCASSQSIYYYLKRFHLLVICIYRLWTPWFSL